MTPRSCSGWSIDESRQIWLDMYMTRVKIAELRNHLSKYLRAVENGEELEITDRDRPIARLVPLEPADKLRIIPAKRPFRPQDFTKYPPANWGVSSTELLLEDRRKR